LTYLRWRQVFRGIHLREIWMAPDRRAAEAAIASFAGMVRAAWNRAFLEELAGFPSGAHDDQVDALARAFAELDAPSYDTSMRWVAGDDPAAAADAMRRLDAQMNMMRFHQQRLWMFGR
jgi:hypothetical protein